MNTRNNEVDILKGILTIGMVFAHTVQILEGSNNPILKAASILTNLVSFSGFLGCFGFACWMAYLSKESIPWKKVIPTTLKCYLAFVLSGIAYRYFVSGANADFTLFRRVLALRDIPGYSEFLIAFSLITLSSVLLAPFLRFLVFDVRRVAFFSLIILFLSQILPKTLRYDPFVGLFLGGSGFAYFPVLLYSPIFVLGAWVARSKHQYNLIAMVVSMAGVLAFVVLTLKHHPINRFPPGAIWVICSSSMVYIYYGVARFIAHKSPRWIRLYLNSVGQNVLLYLLATNIALFLCCALGLQHPFTAGKTITTFFLLMGVIYFFQFISIDLQRANKSLQPTAPARSAK